MRRHATPLGASCSALLGSHCQPAASEHVPGSYRFKSTPGGASMPSR